jgi:hypothetical protein
MKMQPRNSYALCAIGLLVVFVALTGLAAHAQHSLLPTVLDSWQQIEWAQAEAPSLEKLAGSEAPLLREYGSARAERATYRSGGHQWQVTVHEMVDRSAAYGAFTLLGADGVEVPVGEAGSRVAARTLFYRGNYLVLVEGDISPEALAPLDTYLRDRAGQQASLPTLRFYLPRQGFVPGSDRYLLGPLSVAQVLPLAPGDWVGFAYGAEVESARYRRDNEEGTLLLISYPTPAIARARLRDFAQLFDLNAGGNPGHPRVYARRTGTLVAFAAGFETDQAAEGLLEQVRYELKLSWSDPSNPVPQPAWAKTLLGIFLGTGLFLLFALLSGVAYGVLRVAVKRFAPGRVFDRSGAGEDMIVLDLRSRDR